MLVIGLLGNVVMVRAEQPVIIIIPDYEASALVDLNDDREPVTVWGQPDSLASESNLYALRLPNKLVARPMATVGPYDLYQGLIDSLTAPPKAAAQLPQWHLEKTLHLWAYDWRRTVPGDLAPALRKKLKTLSGGGKGGAPLVIIGHGLGGLIARTALAQEPALAERVLRLFVVGTPHRGQAQALMRLLAGPAGLAEPDGEITRKLHARLPGHIDPLAARLVAISHPSLYQLMPSRRLAWSRVDGKGRTKGIADEDLLSLSTWSPFWPSAKSERTLFLVRHQPRLAKQADEPRDEKDWALAQDLALANLQNLLADTRAWREKIGPLSRTAELLNQHAPAGTSRLRAVAARGIKTPVGIVTEHFGERPLTRYLYGAGADGDGVVTVESALDDIPQGEQRVILKDIPHWRLCSHPQFLAFLLSDLADLDGTP